MNGMTRMLPDSGGATKCSGMMGIVYSIWDTRHVNRLVEFTSSVQIRTNKLKNKQASSHAKDRTDAGSELYPDLQKLKYE